ncbi:N-acetylmuramoyl-L-alanine amidase [Rubidibacter lacunae KORDI 51-2]|uniref:N-acetylmuramoyl-L-alanine amidase n=1 Tax=Rubidibacter lacunae KORDI 51-2 TaxID=582515 RepID=U5DDP0_9CHRO|nr:N-acetylmuramoyl-L-alanine amidase [Rubidibacter lacunae]ERN42623.1 N-acetylmuramoyl-L-alanine amidase [Rubidibacter lacunae KORDI 51-2]
MSYQEVKKIYLHWSATSYNWSKPGSYHTVVLGDGTIKRLTAYDQYLSKHTLSRNSNAVGICIACMGGKIWVDYPPTPIQIENMCKEVANLASQLGWSQDDITIKKVMTHAEAAALRDFRKSDAEKASGVSLKTALHRGLPHENYGPMRWHDGWPGGTALRWDLWQLQESDIGGTGGATLRDMVKSYMAGGRFSRSTRISVDDLRACPLHINGRKSLEAYIFTDDSCYAKLADLAKAYKIEIEWNKTNRYVNLVKSNIREPKFSTDSLLLKGYPIVDIFINRSPHSSQPFMQGIIVNNSTWVKVDEFANELSIIIDVAGDFSSVRLGNLTAADGGSLSGTNVSTMIWVKQKTSLRAQPLSERKVVAKGLQKQMATIVPGKYIIRDYQEEGDYFWVKWCDPRILERDGDYIHSDRAEIVVGSGRESSVVKSLAPALS